MATYHVDVELDPWPEGGYVARAPSLQGCWVVAETPEQALADIREGIEMHIAARLRHGEPVPVEVVPTVGQTKVHLRFPIVVP